VANRAVASDFYLTALAPHEIHKQRGVDGVVAIGFGLPLSKLESDRRGQAKMAAVYAIYRAKLQC
jgi:hypothetical protein